jgi:hypothetical protein
MNGSAARLSRFAAGLLLLVTLGWVLTGQAAKPAHHRVSLVTDWSHRHLIFSQPRTAEQAARLQQDPRFEQQLARRSQRLILSNGKAAESSFGSNATPQSAPKHLKMRRDWSADLGTGGSVGAGFFPAKFSFDIEHANCTNDFVVFTTGLPSSNTQASIVAYNNIYSGCGGAVPAVYWAYNTQGTAITSPVLSRDGSQIAFVETQGGTTGELVLIKWQSAPTSSVGAPAPTFFQNTGLQYQACAAPCWTTIDLRDSGGSFFKDTTSSVFYDYTNDIAWVGGETGWLVKVTGVFNGAPAAVHDAIWPKQVNPGAPTPLTSPVFDHVSGNLFVGDAGGFLYSVNSSSGAVTTSGRLDFAGGLVETPIVDASNRLVYVFASSDGSASCTAGVACSAVYKLSTSFAASDTGSKVTVGDSSLAPNPMYSGGFDNAYFSSVNGTGNLYVCGNTGAEPTLYQIPILAGAFTAGAGASITPLGSAGQTPACSPVSDIANPNTNGGPSERVFVSVQDHGINGSCSGGGCLFNFVDAPWQASTTYAVGQQILDSKLHIETVILAGTSGTTVPNWGGTAGGVKTDGIGTLAWVDQGFLTATNLGTWIGAHLFAGNDRIRDSNGNVEVVDTDGISGVTEPVWDTSAGGLTPDGAAIWLNAGPAPSMLKANGGTSGIIMDNVVSPVTLLGVSQIYFSTLLDQACNDGPGGCAVQASQPGLN